MPQGCVDRAQLALERVRPADRPDSLRIRDGGLLDKPARCRSVKRIDGGRLAGSALLDVGATKVVLRPRTRRLNNDRTARTRLFVPAASRGVGRRNTSRCRQSSRGGRWKTIRLSSVRLLPPSRRTVGSPRLPSSRRVEGPAELVEARTLLLEHLTRARSQSGSGCRGRPVAVSEPNEPLTLTRVETRERHDDALTRPESLQDR